MSRANRKSGLSLTPAVFSALHKSLIQALIDNYDISPETLVDYQLYGFNKFDENLPSIKRLVLDKTGKWVNGKYLYNKYRQWRNGADYIHLTREFVHIYFKALNCYDLKDFMLNSSLSEAAIADQIATESSSSNTIDNEYYVGYYIGEEGNAIATRLTLLQESLKVQFMLIYWEKEDEYSEYPYNGTILFQQNGMSLFFKNEDNDLDRSLFISIFCERHLKVKPFMVGAYSGFDRNRQPVVGDMFFQRVGSVEEQSELITKKNINPIIAQYLAGKRSVSLGKTLQNLLDLSPESKFALIIEDFIGSYKGVFVSIENGMFIINLDLEDNLGNSTLRIAGHPIYKGTFKVQASGQLIMGQFLNATTNAPLFMSIEVLPLREGMLTGDLLGVSRFDKSFSGKIYLSNAQTIIDSLPKYRGAELSLGEIRKLPKLILDNIGSITEGNKLGEYLNLVSEPYHPEDINHLTGSYQLSYFNNDKVKMTGLLDIKDTGIVHLEIEHLTYKGKGMICEGGLLSIYFTSVNGIPHCGQIMGKVGKKNRSQLDRINSNWFFIDENFETSLVKIELTPI